MADIGMAVTRAQGRPGLEGEALPLGQRMILSWTPILIFLAAWQITPSVGLISPLIVPPPTSVLAEAIRLTLSGELVDNIIISLSRIIAGLVLAIALALPLGFLLGGWFKTAETAVSPLLQALSQANPFTLFPVFIALLGLGEWSRVTMIFWVALWPVLNSTVSGIKNVDPELVKMARSLGLSRYQLFERVLVPGAVPAIFAGIRFATLLSFFILIGAEMIGASSGLGYMIMQACPFHYASFQLEKMWAGIVTVALLGALMNWTVLQLEKRLSKWKEKVVI